MNINSITAILAAHKGQNIRATWERPLKTRKGVESQLLKRTEAVIRGGIDYENLKAVVEGRSNGDLPAESAGLPWGEWAKFPFHITHKGNDYVRLYPASFDLPCKVSYFMDGKPVSKEVCEPLCLASEFKEDKEKPLCFTLKAESILSID